MPPVTNSTLAQRASKTLCYYFNSTNQIQLIRLWDGRNYSLEKIICLGARQMRLKPFFAPYVGRHYSCHRHAKHDFASYACCGSHRFPQQRILFEAEPENILEVHTKQEGEQLLKSIFTCNKLKIEQFLPQLTAI